jgi:hypothetical protein
MPLLCLRIGSSLEFLCGHSDLSDATEKSRSNRMEIGHAYHCTKATDWLLRVAVEKKEVRVAVLLCSLVLVSAAINVLIIVLGSKGL